MSRHGEDFTQCEPFQDELAELALGILSGRRRSEVLGHVASCPRCTAELERLSVVADTLLLLAPEVEPPLGFELRLAERLQEAAAVYRPRRFRRGAALSAAAVIALALGFGLGTIAAPQNGNAKEQPAAANLTAANLTSHGHVVGEVMISAGSPAWMFMTIEAGAWSGPVTCDVTVAGGTVQQIGAFKLLGGYGAWGAALASPAGQVRSARLVAPDGTVVASAQLSA
jgi:Putative zinc-finger